MSGERPHVLTFGSRWPPETFIARRLERLAAAGFRATHASVVQVGDRPAVELDGVRHLAVLRGRRAPVHAVGQLLRYLPRVWIHSPRRAAAIVRAARSPTAGGRAMHRGEVVERTGAYARIALEKPDVVHFDWTAAASGFASLPEALGCPFVVSCHGSELQVYPYTGKGRSSARSLPRVFAAAAAVHTVSTGLAELATSYGLDREKAVPIPAGVDPAFFEPVPVTDGDGSFGIVCIAVLRWIKGLEYALLTIAELRRRGVPAELDLVGGDPTSDLTEQSEGDRLRAAISDLGLGNAVRLHGFLPPVEIRDRLQRASTYLQTSLSEGLPTAVVEAMACGLPVVASDAGGTREAINDGVEGFLVPLRDVPAAADALERLWREPGLRRTMGKAARRRAVEEFGLEEQTARFADLYRKVIAAGSTCS